MSEREVNSLLMLRTAAQFVAPFLAAWTVALLLLRLHRPRPRLRRALQQPVAVACVAATAAIAIEAAWVLSLLAVGSELRPLATVFDGWSPWQVSFAVIGGWTSLAASGRWRAEPTCIHRRGGRGAGASWIVVTAIHFRFFWM